MAASLEERVAYLEGKAEEHTRAWTDLKDMIIHLEGKVNALDQKVDRRIDALDLKVEKFRDELSDRIEAFDRRLSLRMDSLDKKIDDFDQKILGLDKKIDGFDQKIFAIDQKVDRRIDSLKQRFSRYFLWIIGIQVTIFLAIIATFFEISRSGL